MDVAQAGGRRREGAGRRHHRQWRRVLPRQGPDGALLFSMGAAGHGTSVHFAKGARPGAVRHERGMVSMTPYINIDHRDSVAVVSLDHAPVNALSAALRVALFDA